MIHTAALDGVVINGLVFLRVLALGLFAVGRIGLGAPILDGWLRGQAVGQQARAIVRPALVAGLGLGALLVLVAEFGFGPALQAEIKQQGIVLVAGGHPPLRQGLLALPYGAFFEEQLIRLVVLSLLAWLGSLLFHTVDGRPVPAILWGATILASIPFALGHLPAAAAIDLPLDALVVMRTLALNLPLSIAFGWLFWSRGLESAMLAHFCADVLVVVVAPLVFANWIR
jgi:membrane protease YdiL (CAAX protease family)